MLPKCDCGICLVVDSLKCSLFAGQKDFNYLMLSVVQRDCREKRVYWFLCKVFEVWLFMAHFDVVDLKLGICIVVCFLCLTKLLSSLGYGNW